MEGNVGSGAMSTFAGSNGCWYITKQGTTGILEATAAAPGPQQSFDAAGNTP